MAQRITPTTKVRIVPRDGELEITLNINISVDGQVVASANNADVISVQQVEEQEDKVEQLVPDFTSTGIFGMFGKKSKG